MLSLILPQSLMAEFKKDIVYARRGEQELKLNLALPLKAGTMRPAIICIHGGAWQSGNRQSYDHLIDALAYRGYVAATIDYRLTGVAPWPAQLDDVKAAHRWIVDHATTYGIDPERIAAVGDSAGGHLALLLGTLPTETTDRKFVRGVINYFGPTDLQPAKVQHALGAVEPLIGGKVDANTELLKQISPLTHIGRTDAPVLTFHGTRDTIVPYDDHAIPLHKSLADAKVAHHLETMEGAGHSIGRDRDKYNRLFAEFAHRYLRGSKDPLIAHDDFDQDAKRWELTDASTWKVTTASGRSFFSLTQQTSNDRPKSRIPHNVALLRDVKVDDFVLDVDLRSTEKSNESQNLCVIFGHRDPRNFYYVHIGRTANAQSNSIFRVDDGARVNIATERSNATDWSRGWHRVRIERETDSGKIDVYFDDMQNPTMSARDTTLTGGRVGIGSVDDSGDFDAFRLYGKTK